VAAFDDDYMFDQERGSLAAQPNGAFDKRGDLLLVGHVAGDVQRLVARGGQLRRRRLDGLLIAGTTAAPDSANARAVASPMPAPAPVTTATRS
jgi:hypothetical protein